MSRMNFIVWSTLILIFQSGCMGAKKPIPIPIPVPIQETNSTPISTIKVGIGLEKGNIEKYSNTIKGLYYYGQVVIEPTLTMEALKGPEAQTFLDHVSNVLGEKRKNFGLSATPIIDGQVQPDIVLFNYTFNSTTKEWITYLNEEPRTRMILLKPDTSLSFELKYISIDGKTFNLVKNITNEIYGGSILLAGTSIAYIDLIADKVSTILSSSVSSATLLSFNPVSDPKKSVEYIIKTKEDEKLATVKFSLLLRDSVVSGAVISSELNKIPEVNNFTNPLNAVYTSYTNDFTLNDQLQRDESIVSFSSITDPTQFRRKCQKIINRLETYGLNIFDRYNAFSQILDSTDFLQEHKLFNSGCLSERKLTLLTKMGIPLTPPPSPLAPRIEIDDNSLTNLGRYMLHPVANKGYRSDLLKLFADTVTVENNDLMLFDNFNLEDGDAYMSPSKFMEELTKIGVARFGIYNNQRKRHARFFFRPLNSKMLYRIKLKRVKAWGKINTVVIEALEDDEILSTAKQRKRLRTIADNTVLGYQNDIMREENNALIALIN